MMLIAASGRTDGWNPCARPDRNRFRGKAVMAERAHTTPTTLPRKNNCTLNSPALGGAGAPPEGYTAQQGTVRPTEAHFFSGAFVPDAYGCVLKGDCLAPEINDGDMALASPSREALEGDFVILYFTNGAAAQIKRLVMAPMVPVGTKLHSDSDVLPIVMVEMLNPPRQLATTIDKLTAMHKVVGLIRRDEVAALRNLDAAAFVVSKPTRQRRKAGAA